MKLNITHQNKKKLFCNIARYKYGEYSKEWNVLQEQIGELNTRVPNLDCNPENWDKLSDDELLNFKSDYEAQKLGYEKIYVDEEGHFDIDALNASPDANIYHQIVDTILPNIDIEIENRKLPTSEGETDFIETYKTTWEYFGVNELEIKLTSYQDIVNVLKKSHYDLTWERYQELSKQDNEKYPTLTEDGFKDKHDEYLKNAYQLDENNTDSCAYGRYVKIEFKWASDYPFENYTVFYKKHNSDDDWTGIIGDVYSPEPIYSGSVAKKFDELFAEFEYDIKLSVTDTNGYSEIIRRLPPMSFIIDILKGGKGIAFGRPATLENTFEVDFDAKFDKSIVDKFGEEIQNGLAPNINTTTEDPNTTLKQLIVTNKNTPTGQYMYIETRFFDTKSLTANRSQTAYPYSVEGSSYHRFYYGGSWSPWNRITNASELERV